jgi:ribosome modulation factor
MQTRNEQAKATSGRVTSCFRAPRSLAKMRGHKAGALPNSLPSECPYSHDDLDLRSAWLEGFNTGRSGRAGS